MAEAAMSQPAARPSSPATNPPTTAPPISTAIRIISTAPRATVPLMRMSAIPVILDDQRQGQEGQQRQERRRAGRISGTEQPKESCPEQPQDGDRGNGPRQ